MEFISPKQSKVSLGPENVNVLLWLALFLSVADRCLQAVVLLVWGGLLSTLILLFWEFGWKITSVCLSAVPTSWQWSFSACTASLSKLYLRTWGSCGILVHLTGASAVHMHGVPDAPGSSSNGSVLLQPNIMRPTVISVLNLVVGCTALVALLAIEVIAWWRLYSCWKAGQIWCSPGTLCWQTGSQAHINACLPCWPGAVAHRLANVIRASWTYLQPRLCPTGQI